MTQFKLETPVVLIIFNRPDTTARVFAEIAKAKPPKLLVIADGPRKDRAGEEEKCVAARAIINQVDWPCEVLINYSDVNLGCKIRVSSGLDWVFEQVEEAIILEDDCLPDPTFFRFCQEMLQHYRYDKRIGMISGDNFQFGIKRGDASYYFSRYSHIWGWASWRRAWNFYDKNLTAWPKLDASGLLNGLVSTPKELKYWSRAFQGVYENQIDTWDYQWTMALWLQGMLTVLPNVNLISNIGFGQGATHTFGNSIYANMKTSNLDFPLKHPDYVFVDMHADLLTAKEMFTTSLLTKLIRKLKAVLN